MVSIELIVFITGASVVSTLIYQWLCGESLLLRSTRPSAKPQPRRLARLAVARKSPIFGMTRILEPCAQKAVSQLGETNRVSLASGVQ